MTDRQKEQRESRYSISCYRCEVCGKNLNDVDVQAQIAHRIGNTTTNRELYGSFFIDSVENCRAVCSLGCNASVDVGKSKGKVLNALCDILRYEVNKFLKG